MKVKCGDCPARYAVADERIAGKKVRLRCKRCGASIVVNGKVEPPEVSCIPAGQSSLAPGTKKPIGGEATSTGSPEATVDASTSAPTALPPSRPPAPTMMGGLEAPTGDSSGFPVLQYPFGSPDEASSPVGDVDGDGTVAQADNNASAPVRTATTSAPPPSRRSRAEDNSDAESDAPDPYAEDHIVEPPEQTVPFSLDVSRASNRPAALEEVSFLAMAEQAVEQSSSTEPDPSPEALAKHLTSPPPAKGTSPSMAPPAVPVASSSWFTWLFVAVVLLACAAAGLYYFGEQLELPLPL